MTGEILLTPTEAADLMGITVEELATWRTTGQGPAWGQWKGTVRYAATDVRDWLDQQQQ